MPLLNRRPYNFVATQVDDLPSEQEVWVVKATGEVCRSYEAYVQKVKLYEEPVWSCKYSGKGGLTLEEAQAAEHKALTALKGFPKDLEEQVCRAVHHSTQRVDELVGSIYDCLRPAAVEEPAGAAAPAGDKEQQAGVQQDSPSPFGSKENEQQQGVAAGEPAVKPAVPAGEPAEAGAGGHEAAAGPEPATAKKPEGGTAAAEGGKSGKKPKTPKAPVSRPVLRTFIIENAEQQGPEHATKQVWVVRPELREQYGLPAEVPADVQEKVAASVKAPKKKLDGPKGLGTKLPAKKDAKKAAAGAAGSPLASATPGGSKAGASGEASSKKERGPLVAVQAKSLEEVEKQYKEGTIKHVIVEVLKAVKPEALTTQGIVDKAKELGLREFEDKQKAIINQSLSSDPTFLRLSKGAYSLHCFHPDKEQLVKAPQPKEAKEPKKSLAMGSPAAGSVAAGEGAAGSPKAEKEAVPMVAVQAKSLDEVEKQYKEGTIKHGIVEVLKAVKPEALSAQAIVDKAKELNIEGLADKQKTILQALSSDPTFLRLSKGTYSLHCFYPDKEQLVKAPQPKEAKEPRKSLAMGSPAASGKGGEPKEPEKDAVPMVAVQAKTWEEVEKLYKEGTIKHVLVEVLRAVQPEALTTQGIVDKAKELGLREFEDKQKAIINQSLSSDPTFLRLSKGAYSLHCFHPDKEQLVKDKKRKISDHFADGEEPGSKRREGSSGQQAGEEVDSIIKAEQHVNQTKRSLELHRSALEKAQAEYDAAKPSHEQAKKQLKSPSKAAPVDKHIPAELLAQFEMTEAEREYKGESDDLKAKLEHRQKVAARAKELEKAKQAFIKDEEQKRQKAAASSNAGLRAVESAFKKAERQLEQCRRAAESAEKAAAAAEKRLEKEREKVSRGEEKAKEIEEREKQRLMEREERERRKEEAARAKEDAKRYPMDDLELLEELQQKAAQAGEAAPEDDVAQPNWKNADESQRLSTALYIADFVGQFHKQLGCRGLNYEHLEQALADASSSGGSKDEHCNASLLYSVYENLMRVILDDLCEEDVATAQEKRWDSLLSEGTWPEVLRRFMLTRVSDEEHHKRPDRASMMSASMLTYDAVDALTHDQHLSLLRFLCDTSLDSDKMREVLQRREDEAVDVKRDVREELAEQRKQLKELLDAEKEERKRKRDEEWRAAEEAAAAAAAAAAEGAEGGSSAAAQQDAQKPSSKQGSVAPMDVDGPSFELPERLREYTGSGNDKKALVQWRQEQQAEKRRLDKERNKWMAEQLRMQQEVDAAEKAAREAEKALQREKEEKEEAIFRAQEALEEKLEKYSVRRVPLGTDRHHRRYWWGLAGRRAALYVEDCEGRWGSLTSAAQLDALVASLERRGVRELALAEAIEKRFQAISMAMLRAERLGAGAGGSRAGKQEKERAEPARRSGRQTQQVEFFNPAKSDAKDEATATGLASVFGPAECAAVEAAVEDMVELQKSGSSVLAVPEGCGNWKEWSAGVQAVAEGELEEGASGEATAAAVRGLLQTRLVQLEAALMAESVGGLAADEEPSDEEGSEGAEEHQGSGGQSPEGSAPPAVAGQVLEVVDELFSPSKRPDVAFLWKTQRERSAWQADLRQAATAARVAYCAAVLAQQAAPMLATLRKSRTSGPKKNSGKSSGKASGGSGGSKAATASNSRPVSRSNSQAALDEAPRKNGKAKGKRKATAPENMRQTRSRH